MFSRECHGTFTSYVVITWTILQTVSLIIFSFVLIWLCRVIRGNLLLKLVTRTWLNQHKRSLNMVSDRGSRIINMFLANVLFYAVVCRGFGFSSEELHKINKLIRKAGSIIAVTPDALAVLEQRMGSKFKIVRKSWIIQTTMVSVRGRSRLATGLSWREAVLRDSGSILIWLQWSFLMNSCPRMDLSVTVNPRRQSVLHPAPYRHRWEQRSLSQITTVLCSGASVVEQTPDQRQDSRVGRHIPQKTQDSLVQPTPQPCIA